MLSQTLPGIGAFFRIAVGDVRSTLRKKRITAALGTQISRIRKHAYDAIAERHKKSQMFLLKVVLVVVGWLKVVDRRQKGLTRTRTDLNQGRTISKNATRFRSICNYTSPLLLWFCKRLKLWLSGGNISTLGLPLRFQI